jgi:hypothetical protein
VFLGDLSWLVLVAAVTGVFHIALQVAGTAGGFTPLAVIQWKAVHAQEGRAPRLRSVAILAIHAKESGVDGWLSVALDARIGRAGEDLPGMAILASDTGVFPLQGEDRFVAKSRHAIGAIVTVCAPCPVLLLVLAHEGCPFFSKGVAARTAPQIEVSSIPQMAIITRQRAAIIVLPVAI